MLLGAAGLVQATLGAVIPDWTGDKLAPVGLGLLTVGLAALALVAARRFRRPERSPGHAGRRARWRRPGRACCASTTVGVLAWVPAVLLVAAGVLAVADGAGEAARAVVAHRPQVLLSALGAASCSWRQRGAVAHGPSAPPAARHSSSPRWLPARHRVLVGARPVGTAPLAIAGWFALVPRAGRGRRAADRGRGPAIPADQNPSYTGKDV